MPLSQSKELNSANHSFIEIEGAITAQAAGVIDAPANVSAFPVSPTRIYVLWTDVATNEDTYVVSRGPTTTGPWTELARLGQNSSSYSDAVLLSPSTTYFYQVQAIDSGGVLTPSTPVVVSARTFEAAPPAPANFRQVSATTTTIGLAWNASAGATFYTVERRLTGSAAGYTTVSGQVTGTSFTAGGLVPDTGYDFNVWAYNVDNVRSATPGNLLNARTAPVVGSPNPPSFLAKVVNEVGGVQDVVLDPTQRYAYVATFNYGLVVIDLTVNPNRPVVIGKTEDFSATKVSINTTATRAAVTGSLGISVVDISTPSAPVILFSVTGEKAYYPITAIAGNYLYMGVYQDGPNFSITGQLITVDLTARTVIDRKSFLTNEAVPQVSVVGNRLYLTAGNKFKIYDITAASGYDRAPRFIAETAKLPLGTSGGCICDGTFALGTGAAAGYAYTFAGNRINVVNFTNENLPAAMGYSPLTAYVGAQRGVVTGNRLYAPGGYIFDVSNPTVTPSQFPQYSGRTEFQFSGFDVSGTTIYGGNQYYGLVIVNASTPTAIQITGNVGGVYPADVSVSGSSNLAAVAGGPLGLKIVNVATPSAPTLVGALSGTMNTVAVAGTVAYAGRLTASGTSSELVVVNLANSAAPSVGATFSAGTKVLSVKTLGSFLYVLYAQTAGNPHKLDIYNISSPLAPAFANSITTTAFVTPSSVSPAGSMAVANDYVYIAEINSIEIVDARTKAALTKSSYNATCLTPETCVNLTVSGGKLFTIGVGNSNPPNYLKILSLSNPIVPALLGASVNLGFTNSLAVNGNEALVGSAGSFAGFDVSVLPPIQNGGLSLSGYGASSYAVTSQGNYFYAADAINILTVINP